MSKSVSYQICTISVSINCRCHGTNRHTTLSYHFFFASLFTKYYLEANSNSHTKSVMKCFIKTYQNIYHTRIRIKIRTIIIINTLQFDSGWFPNYFAVFFVCFVGILFCWAPLLIWVFKRMYIDALNKKTQRKMVEMPRKCLLL